MIILIKKKKCIVCLKYKILKSCNYKVNGSESGVFKFCGFFLFLKEAFFSNLYDR